MSWTPSTIPLICRGRYDEAVANADVYPGMLALSQSTGKVIPHNVVGGIVSPLIVVQENALLGGDIATKIASGSVTPLRRPARGDVLLMLLQNGQMATEGNPLMSAGDGTLIPFVAVNNPLYEIVAPSTNITNTGSETTFSNGTYTFPANFLLAGDVIKITGKAVVSAQNSTNTHDVKVYIGSTTLADCGAAALAATNYAQFSITMTVRTVGASGKFVADVVTVVNPGGTEADTTATIASTTIDTTATEAVTVKSTASAASTGNVIALQEFLITILRNVSAAPVVYAAETIDNSGGAGSSPVSDFSSAAFIRCQVP